MKKTRILILLIIPFVTLTGCAIYDKQPDANSYYCQRIIHKMHSVPPRYRASGTNKPLPTTLSRLQKEYYHYDCELYQHRKAASKSHN